MITQIFVNLPTKDLAKTMEFWKALGFSFNPQFTDEKAGALVLNETKGIFAMLITEPFFKTFTKKEIANTGTTTEVINAIAVESKEEAQEMVRKAVAAGGSTYRDPQDYGWMYSEAFQDIDGHQWEPLYMDLSKMPANNT